MTFGQSFPSVCSGHFPRDGPAPPDGARPSLLPGFPLTFFISLAFGSYFSFGDFNFISTSFCGIFFLLLFSLDWGPVVSLRQPHA